MGVPTQRRRRAFVRLSENMAVRIWFLLDIPLGYLKGSQPIVRFLRGCTVKRRFRLASPVRDCRCLRYQGNGVIPSLLRQIAGMVFWHSPVGFSQMRACSPKNMRCLHRRVMIGFGGDPANGSDLEVPGRLFSLPGAGHEERRPV